MAHDVFLSYATQDKPTADAVCARLEQHGIRCWIAPRDILPGRDWRTSIVEAIGSARALVLMLSAQANSSSEVPKEILQATQRSLPIITFRIEDVTPSGSLSYELNSIHWLDALTKPLERHIDTLAGTLQKVLNVDSAPVAPTLVKQPPRDRSTVTLIAAVAGTVVATLAATLWFVGRPGTAPAQQATIRSSTGAESSKPVEPPPQPPISASGSGSLSGSRQGASASTTTRPPQPAPAPASSPAPRPDAKPRPANVTGPASSTMPPADPAPTPPIHPLPTAVPDPAATVTTPGQIQAAVPVVGCWRYGSAPGLLVVRPDGTFVSDGVKTGTWTTLNRGSNTYAFQNPDDVGYGEMSADGRRLTNPAAPNDPLIRISGGPDLPGAWRFSNGVTLSIEANGSAKIATLTGKWKAVEQGRRMYEFKWPGSRPTMTIVGDVMKIVDVEKGAALELQRVPCAEGSGRPERAAKRSSLR